MSDIMADSSFVKAFKAAQSNSLASTQNKSKNAGLLPSIPDLKNKNIALVEPDVEILESSKKTLRTMDLIKDNSTDLILQEAENNGYKVSTDNAPSDLTIEGINTFMYVKSALRQSNGYSKVNFFPVDYTVLKDLSKKYSSDVILIPLIYYVDMKKSYPMEVARPVLATWYVPPMALILVTGKLLESPRTQINFVGVDLSNGHADFSKDYTISGKPSRILLGSKY